MFISSATISRRDDTWPVPKCLKTGPGYCTIYIATSDDDVPDYRGAALFDNNCNLLQAVKGSKTTPKLTLKGVCRDM
ncbi:hypothetical protein GLAREA_03194 [Glarea lozoyensis ATCC 20868]|uniref:Uncharacterized protein n=1 Tax=Glarea lozoyensis (strain ATCC 20868 / MF5171) TaxID=1116229 RepID=S3CQA5_GLAL2|nr:uncharacterized protein GLAREA_03194 [Glarea lozoyensis ATCC 20868]EPE27279.1 hypothetical protein GLAREA_03194 [Glarea lozoyensis ATCC 20868]